MKHVIAAIRPASASKPGVEALRARGAEIRIVDLESESTEQLQEHLKGVDTVISAISWTYFSSQKPLIRASKEAGVKRFIPCDWGTPCTRGLAWVFDLVSFSFFFSRVSIPAKLYGNTESYIPGSHQRNWTWLYLY